MLVLVKCFLCSEEKIKADQLIDGFHGSGLDDVVLLREELRVRTRPPSPKS